MPVGNESVKRRYLQIKDGKLAEFKGETTWNLYNHISRVHLVNITFRKVRKSGTGNDGPVVGNMLQLHLIDANDYFVLEMWYNDQYAKCFYNLMENLNLLDEISLFVDEKTQDGKLKKSLFMRQAAGWVKHKYTKDNLGLCPPLQVSYIADATYPDGQKKVLNDDLQMSFYLEQISTQMLPRLEKKFNPFPNHLIFEGIVGNKIAGNHFNAQELPVAVLPIGPVDDLPF